MLAAAIAAGRLQADVPTVTLTFDDNTKGHFSIAAPVLERYGYRGAFNIITDTVGKDDRKMTWDDIRELHRRGHEIVSHSATHPNLMKLLAEKGPEAVMRELVSSRDAIRRETGSAPRFFCHPYIASNTEIEALVRSAGMTPMPRSRRNFGEGTTPAKFAAFLDGLVAKKNARCDIMFHGITKETGGWRPFASRADFEGCIAALAAREKKGLLRVVGYETFAGRGRGRLCLTFDDRNWERWVAAMPIFERYGARASFFASGSLDDASLASLKRLYDAGHTVGPHTQNHRNAPESVAGVGFDAYWEEEVAPQMKAFASVGIFPRSMAYPNNRHDAATDAGFIARGVTRLRAGVPGARPYDPKGLKRSSLVPFPELDAMYLTADEVRTNAVMPGVGIGRAYQTDIDDLCEGLRRAARRNETVVLFSHDISPEPNGISMKTRWLERILETASREGMSICGFDDLPSLDVTCVSGSARACGSLEAGFRRPPDSARPQTWWHWMNGNVTREGITADLEAMKEIGLGGATLFDAGCGVPSGPLKFASAQWYDFVKHAASEARRLGLEICLPNCSGWSSSGGPWVSAADNMKELVRVERRYTGPRRIREKLPPLPDPHGFAADIACLAVPVPPAESDTMEKAGAVVTSPSKYVRRIDFPEPFAADGIFFRVEHDWMWEVGGDVKVEISDDGESYTEVMTADATIALRAGFDLTERYRPFPREVKARFYRLTFSFRVIGLDKGDYERIKKIKVASVRVGRAKSLSYLCDKTFAKRIPVTADPDTAKPDQIVAKDSVRVLKPSADGILDWDVPAGEWRVIRLGFAANGKKNHPASDFGGGFEVDKLSAAALDRHFEKYAAKLVRHLGPLAGDVPSGLAGILVDSYEIGSQNWTQGFEKEFLKRRGYDMTAYLPVLAGVVVGSVDESERFLADFRRTVADLFVSGYSGALAKKCRQYGLRLWLEPYGNCPCDDLEYGDEVDVPMSEFWSRVSLGDRYVDTGNASIPGYLAHVWGRRYVAAEAFTTAPPSGGRWTTTPFAIKAQGDRAFTKGVNRLVFHRFCHQPYVGKGSFAAPGFTLGPYGMHLDRTQTWWKQGRPYMDYLARCQWMLQEGEHVADVLFWHGEEVPSRGGHIAGYPEDFKDYPVPAGFKKDVCSTRALKALTVADGKIVAPGGARYEMLVLRGVTEMSFATLEAIGRLVDAGATVVAPRMPEKVIGLWRYPEGDGVIRSLAGKIRAKGIIAGDAAEGIAARGLTPDFICLSAPEGLAGDIAWIHRGYANGADAYFVACPNERAGDFTCSFRVDGREPELWDAENGETGIAPKSWRRVGGRTEVTFTLPPSGSAFIVFRKPTEDRAFAGDSRAPAEEAMDVTTSWRVVFPVGWYSASAETKALDMERLVDWTALDDDDLRYFSGTVRYEAELPQPALQAALRVKAAGRRVSLDLGEVKNFADLTVNGKSFRTLWRPPFRVDITDALKEGDNRMTVKVTNLWPNRMIGDERLCASDCEWDGKSLKEIPAFIREGRPSPTGRKTFATWYHWKKDDKLLPSGLLGPVRLVFGAGK